jgi:site-specific DNA recombinase
LWDEFFPAEQARILQLLVERFDIREARLDVRLGAEALSGLLHEFGLEARAAA